MNKYNIISKLKNKITLGEIIPKTGKKKSPEKNSPESMCT